VTLVYSNNELDLDFLAKNAQKILEILSDDTRDHLENLWRAAKIGYTTLDSLCADDSYFIFALESMYLDSEKISDLLRQIDNKNSIENFLTIEKKILEKFSVSEEILELAFDDFDETIQYKVQTLKLEQHLWENRNSEWYWDLDKDLRKYLINNLILPYKDERLSSIMNSNERNSEYPYSVDILINSSAENCILAEEILRRQKIRKVIRGQLFAIRDIAFQYYYSLGKELAGTGKSNNVNPKIIVKSIVSILIIGSNAFYATTNPALSSISIAFGTSMFDKIYNEIVDR
jgi:hypothetical protein